MGEPTSRSRLSAVFLVATGWLVGASVSAQTPRPGGVPSEPSEASGVGLLPQGDVFRPLIADPKQPEFLASYLFVSGSITLIATRRCGRCSVAR